MPSSSTFWIAIASIIIAIWARVDVWRDRHERKREKEADRIREDRTILSEFEILNYLPPALANSNKRGDARRKLKPIDSTTSDAAEPIRLKYRKVKLEVRNTTPEAASAMIKDLVDEILKFMKGQ